MDVRDPPQPGPLNLTEIARQFGGEVAFSGGIDDPHLENYSPQEVRDMVGRAIATLGRPYGTVTLLQPLTPCSLRSRLKTFRNCFTLAMNNESGTFVFNGQWRNRTLRLFTQAA